MTNLPRKDRRTARRQRRCAYWRSPLSPLRWPAAIDAARRAARALSHRLSRTPSDHAEGRRAHGRGFRRPQSRRAVRRASAPTCLPSRNSGGTKPPAASSWTFRAAAPTDRAAADSMHEVQSILAASGVPRNAIYVRPYKAVELHARQHQAQLRARSSPTAGPCGLWPHDLGTSLDRAYTENQPYWNLGCASQRNLAAMVDNPADLVQPRGETPALPRAARSRSTSTARAKIHPAPIPPTTIKSKISDLGK